MEHTKYVFIDFVLLATLLIGKLLAVKESKLYMDF